MIGILIFLSFQTVEIATSGWIGITFYDIKMSTHSFNTLLSCLANSKNKDYGGYLSYEFSSVYDNLGTGPLDDDVLNQLAAAGPNAEKITLNGVLWNN